VLLLIQSQIFQFPLIHFQKQNALIYYKLTVMTRNPNLNLSYIDNEEPQNIKSELDASLIGSSPDWWWTGKAPI